MNTENFGHEEIHLMGESATDPAAADLVQGRPKQGQPPSGGSDPRKRWSVGAITPPCGHEPAASSRLACARPDSPLGPVQLPFLG
ncbi:MAG TPA: hypothetical protein VFY22_12345 [Hydrogenophaga sp.]|nr:hypothetical protein [Hydrogenophaga sp.]